MPFCLSYSVNSKVGGRGALIDRLHFLHAELHLLLEFITDVDHTEEAGSHMLPQ